MCCWAALFQALDSNGGLWICFAGCAERLGHLEARNSPAKKRTRITNSWLVVSNIFYFSISWEESSQLTFIFFRGVQTTNQIVYNVSKTIINHPPNHHLYSWYKLSNGSFIIIGLPKLAFLLNA